MNGSNLRVASIVLIVCLYCGCARDNGHLGIMSAQYTQTEIKVDGELSEPVWQKTPVYKMYLLPGRSATGILQQGGEVQLAWDDDHFYVAIRFEDSDIIAEGEEDELHHYRFGDVCELFLKPENAVWYWELYVTPGGKKTTFWHPSKGQLESPRSFKYKCDLNVAAQYNGTLNHSQDRDSFWTAELAVSAKQLGLQEEQFGPDAPWRIMIGRYNRSDSLSEQTYELSSVPRLSRDIFHLVEEYAILRLAK